MKIRKDRQENQLLINLVFRLLPVQAMIVAMGSINFELLREDSPYKNIGTRIIHGLASDITYQNLIGLNVLTLVIENH